MQLTVKTFKKIEGRFTDLVGKETFDKECSFALQHLSKNLFLQQSTPESLLVSVLNIAQVGLTLNPVMKLAYLVPRRDWKSNTVICHLEPSYQGLVKLLTDSKSVINVYAHLIYSNDAFEQILGTQNEIIHKPKLGNRGDIIGVYGVGVLQNGDKQTEVMDVSEVNEIRDSSESYKSFKSGKSKSCIWNDWYDEMARKTVIKRLVKYLPKSNHHAQELLMKSIDLDNNDHQMNDGQANLIDSLLLTSTITEERKCHIEEFMVTFSHNAAQQTIELLKDNQVDKLQNGMPASQADIKKSLEKL